MEVDTLYISFSNCNICVIFLLCRKADVFPLKLVLLEDVSITGKDLEIPHELTKVMPGMAAPKKMEIYQRVNSHKILFIVVLS